jgi:hypothetical protein
MTIIVETGAGVTGAASYVSLADADSHFAALQRTDWGAAPTARRELVLAQASQHVDFYDYPGQRLNGGQGLKWPRRAAADAEGRALTGLPHALRAAVLELADGYLTAPPSALDGRRAIAEKVGPVELVYASSGARPSFVFRLLLQIGARPRAHQLVRG